MSNKYIDVIYQNPKGSANKAASAGLGMLLGAGFLIAIPFMAMSADRQAREKREEEDGYDFGKAAIQRAHDKMAAPPPKGQESSTDRLFAAM